MTARPARSARKTAVLAIVALAVTLGASACSRSAAEAGGGDTFTYWSMWKVGEPQQKVIASAIADFEKQTGIHVKAQWQGRSNLQKLTPALNTNSVPDLVDGPYVKAYPALVATEQALGLKAAYATKVDGKPAGELIPQKYLKAANINLPDGQPWMLPYQVQSDAVWYNGATLPDVKANPPTTWDQFVALLEKTKASGVAPIAADGDVSGYNAAWLATLIVREGGPGTLKEIAQDPSGQAWKQPLALDAAKKVERLVKGGFFISGYGASKFPLQQQKWANNKAAFIFMGSWLPTESGSYAAAGFDYQSFPFPKVGEADSMRADLSGFMVPKKAKHADAAQKFAAFFLGKKYQDAWGRDAKVIPVREDSPTSPELAGVQAALKSATSYHQQNDGVAFPGYNEKLFWANSDQLFLGKVSAQQFVDKMAIDQAEYWKKQRK
jgi:raffinose/stachyose/melibiose transport system substrate-binding protein